MQIMLSLLQWEVKVILAVLSLFVFSHNFSDSLPLRHANAAEVVNGNDSEHISCLSDTCEVLEFVTPELRMGYLTLQSHDGEILDYTDKGRFGIEEDWEITFLTSQDDDKYVTLKLVGAEGPIRREISYLLFCETSEVDEGRTIAVHPLIATEYAYDREGGNPLYRHQTADFKLITGDGFEIFADREKAMLWGLENLEALVSVSVIDVLSDYLWHNQQLDSPPGSYNGIIAFLERRIELYPMNYSQYADAAWLWWSKWVTWKKNPDKMPDGEGGVEKAIELLHKGRAANPESAKYFFDAAMTISSLARYHLPEKYEFVENFILKAEELVDDEGDQRKHVRIRLSVAHMYRIREKHGKAIEWYRKVLEVEPENEIALRYLKRLEAAQNGAN